MVHLHIRIDNYRTTRPIVKLYPLEVSNPLYIKDRDEETKVYICIFTCTVTRAVHIEVVCDLSVQTFLLAFRRFSSHKSLPSVMISDNASTFLAAAEDLQRLFESETLQRELERHNVTWRFIPKWAMVWWLLGENGWSDKASHQEDTGKSICHAQAARDYCYRN